MSNMPKLQDYADAYWDGDRYRALYDLLFFAEFDKGRMDDYIDELSTEEANFVYDCMHKKSHYAYGSEENFKKAWRAELYADLNHTALEDLQKNGQNPYAKSVLVGLAKMAGVIALTVVVTLLNKAKVLPIDSKILSGIPAVLSGLVAMTLASDLINFFRYRKARKIAQAAPKVDPNAYTPTFEECMEYYISRTQKQTPKNAAKEAAQPANAMPVTTAAQAPRHFKPIPATTAAETTAAVEASGKQNWAAFAYLFLTAAIYFISMFAAYFHWIAGTICCLGSLTLMVWQLRAMGKACKRARDAVSGLPGNDPSVKQLGSRQSLAVLAFLLIAGLYIIVTTAGVGMTIAMIVTR